MNRLRPEGHEECDVRIRELEAELRDREKLPPTRHTHKYIVQRDAAIARAEKAEAESLRKTTTINDLLARVAELKDLIHWTLGEGPIDSIAVYFPEKPDDWPKRPFYWRSALRAQFEAREREEG